ncbi:MAG: DUF2723 domain-containing protein [Bacteroidales bacterium]|nr:DUF2723 domain-containing protein [Bacteroidales bacterium]
MDKKFKIINTVMGWIVGLLATMVYFLTAEPTVSFWDCGEYIATACKLQVGHPPGAPTFQLIGCLFAMFAQDAAHIAICINRMSALCSGLTIMFLFWSISLFAKRIALKSNSELSVHQMIAVFGSALIGAAAYTFSDTFWFSAVEGEVYAMSSFFTALVFWAILKWDEVADDNGSYRWLILIAYLVGLSIGVHLLNLLTLPAMVLVVYYRKYKPTTKGVIYALLLSFVMIALILWGIVPWIVKLTGAFERLFVNGFHAGFNTGAIVYFLVLAALIVAGILYSEKTKKRLLNILTLCFAFILIGYSTFFILVIRSNANTPLDENNPDDAVALLAYLNRDQYGKTPLVYGPYYNSPIDRYKDGRPSYVKNYVVLYNGQQVASFFSEKDAQAFLQENQGKYANGKLQIRGKYVIGDSRENSEVVYNPQYCTLFPRMWNREGARIRQYKIWADIQEDYEFIRGQRMPRKPTFGENMKFFWKYQMGYMYARYFMWNFAGRQTVDQGFGGQRTGNWLSGVKFLDEARLGPQDMPKHMKNPGNNKYYFLPLLLGLAGLFFQFKKDSHNGMVVMALFVMTGIAIGIYLNMYAYQPRERDYAFAIWIGLGVYAIYHLLQKKLNAGFSAIAATAVCVCVPAVMGAQNWDDHDRSNRYLTREIAKAYLDSCAPNAILFTNGDNDTFPLWYLQEVEGYRTDVRICNLSLAGTDWYLDQMKRKAYEGAPAPIQMTKEMYQQGTRDLLIARNEIRTPQNLCNVMKDIMFNPQNNKREAYIRTLNFYLDVDKDKVLANGTVHPSDSNRIVNRIVWRMPNETIYQANEKDTIMIVSKAYIAMMDILANNNWERPIYYVSTTSSESFFGLDDYFQLEGLAYRLVPVKEHNPNTLGGLPGRINPDVLYENVKKFDFSEYARTDVYFSEDYTRTVSNLKMFMLRLADAYVAEQRMQEAKKALDLCYAWFPQNTIPYDNMDLYLGELYLKCELPDAMDAGLKLFNDYVDQMTLENLYFARFKGKKADIVREDWNRNRAICDRISQLARFYQNTEGERKTAFAALEAKATAQRDGASLGN